MGPQRHRYLPLVAGVVLAAAFGTIAPVARSSCAAPTLEIAGRGPYEVGQTIEVRGRYWTPDCNDTIVCTTGACGGQSCEGGGPARPARDIELRLVGAGDDVALAEGLTGLAFGAEIIVPDVPAGRYRIEGESRGTGAWSSEPFRIEALSHG